MKFSRNIPLAVVVILSSSILVHAQSSATLTETVNKRATLGALTATPSTGLTAGASVTFGYILHTGGAPAPTSETVQFLDGTTPIGSAEAIGSIPGSNLLPYAQISTGNVWVVTGTAPVVTVGAVTGPDASSNTATQVVYPDTTSAGNSGIKISVPGTAYASSSMTFSVWAQSASPTSLTLTLADSPSVAALSSTTCAVTSTWQRCTLTYAFPANAGTGFSAALSSTGVATQSINLWGAQVEQAITAGPFVSTIGVARPAGGQAGSVTLPYSAFHQGTHVVTAYYAGDSNFVSSTSTPVTLSFAKATPGMALAGNPVSSSIYGESITYTATLTGPSGYPTDIPTGTVQFFDGATPIGTGTSNSSGIATLTLTGTASLPAGSHSITAVYAGDPEFNTVTSSELSYTVSKVSNGVTTTVTSSLNPSIYGDSVTLSILVTPSVGITPTGTVSIIDSATSLGTVTLDGSGAATLTVPLFTAGTHTLTVTYSGDGNYN